MEPALKEAAAEVHTPAAVIQPTGLSNAASLPAIEIYAHTAAVFQTAESPTAAVLQAVRIHIPAAVALPAESSGAAVTVYLSG